MTTHTLANLVFPSNPTAERLEMMRNMLVCQLESAQMMARHAPFGANMILGLAIDCMLHYRFWQANRALPGETELFAALDTLDHHLGQLARRFHAETDVDVRLSLADQIAESTIQPCECIGDDVLVAAGS